MHGVGHIVGVGEDHHQFEEIPVADLLAGLLDQELEDAEGVLILHLDQHLVVVDEEAADIFVVL